jgi:hypothetical protein
MNFSLRRGGLTADPSLGVTRSEGVSMDTRIAGAPDPSRNSAGTRDNWLPRPRQVRE